MRAMQMTDVQILLLPGLGNSGEDHWQTHWERRFGYERVQQDEWDTPSVKDWVSCLNSRIMINDSPKILVAHSLACCLVAHWSCVHTGPVIGALLVAPSDVEGPNYPQGPIGFSPMPMQRLPFPSMVVASSDDIYVSHGRGQLFSASWGSEYRLLESRGHIGSASRLGLWSEGQKLLEELIEKCDK